MTRVLIAEDHTLVRQGLRLLLEELPGIEVVGETADGFDALGLIEKVRPDVVLMDLPSPEQQGLEAVARAAKRFPASRICVLSSHGTETIVHQAFSAGATGFLLKGADRAELAQAIHDVAAGKQHIGPAKSPVPIPAPAPVTPPHPAPVALLTPRQRQVLQLIAEGRPTKAIARRLGVSAKTVETHRANLMERLGIHDIPGLVRLAIRAGLVTLDQ